MALHAGLSLKGSSTLGGFRHWAPGMRLGAVALALVVLVPAGCTSGGASSPDTVNQHSGTPAGTAASNTAGQSLVDDIPAGRGIAEGGGDPLTYTFREERRRARPEAQKWRAGAYVVSAAGSFVNDDGVPSSWTIYFIDKAAADAVLIVEIDPWGKVTKTREVTGGGVSSFVGAYTKRMPYGIIDSDTAAGAGKAALAARYDLAKTKDPRLGLNFSLVDGSGPYWTYTLFNKSTAEYVTAQIDALTGEIVQPG